MIRMAAALIVSVVAVSLLLGCGSGSSHREQTGDLSGRIYVDVCGSTGHLAYRPRHWSNGCTGESANVRAIKWSSWGGPKPIGKGRALQAAGPEGPLYKGPATLQLYRVQGCTSPRGRQRRYYSRVRYAAYLGPSQGWDRQVFKTLPNPAECWLAQP
jgi:hypothetical protein